jgi:hypothetical protein
LRLIVQPCDEDNITAALAVCCTNAASTTCTRQL